MNSEGTSLLDFLDAPVLVGDPEGNVIYVNPAFSECFDAGESAIGSSFAEVFQGGGREAFLMAVSQVCGTGERVQFRLREEGRGYIGVASPIEAAANRVGVMILLSDEPFSLPRLSALQRDIEEPLEGLVGSLEELRERIAGPGSENVCSVLDSALDDAERTRKAIAGLRELVPGQNSPAAKGLRLDPVKTLRAVGSRASGDCERAGVKLEILAPRSLPRAVGDSGHLETVLLRMVRDRVAQCDEGEHLVLGVRALNVSGEDSVVFSLVAPSRPDTPPGLRRLRDSIATLGGFRHSCVHSASGRATVILLPLAAGEATKDAED